MTTIDAIYYDGKSAKDHSIQIHLHQDFLSFSVSNEIEPTISKQWEINKIEQQDFSTSNQLLLFYGTFPQESIKIQGTEFVQLVLDKYPSISNQNFVYNQVLGKNKWQIIALSSFFIITIIAFYYLFFMPIVSEKIVSLFPKKAEIELGEKMTETLLDEIKVAGMKHDKTKSKLLMQFYQQTGFSNTYPIKIHFIQDSMVNAFAIPGGNIIVYKGIIDKMKNEEELAGLLAHELAHIQQRHSLKALSENLTNYFILSLITSDISGLAAIFIENVSVLQTLANSRSFEKEADILGYKTMKNKNINPKGMVDLFTHIKEKEDKLTENQKKYLSFMVTHPLTEDRIAYLSKKIKDDKIERNIVKKNEVLTSLFLRIK
jgi:beta-barrel assembly-enhancing protease